MPQLTESQLKKLTELFKQKAAMRDLKEPQIKSGTKFGDESLIGVHTPEGKIYLSEKLDKESPESQAQTVFHELQHEAQLQHPKVISLKENARQKLREVPDQEHLMNPYKIPNKDLENQMQLNTRDNLKAIQSEGRAELKKELDAGKFAQRVINRMMYGKEMLPPGLDVEKMMDTQRKNIGEDKIKQTFEQKLREALSEKEDGEFKKAYIKAIQ